MDPQDLSKRKNNRTQQLHCEPSARKQMDVGEAYIYMVMAFNSVEATIFSE